MKKILLLLLLLPNTAVFAQETLKQTNCFSITGQVKNTSVITMDSLKSYQVNTIGDIAVTDHTGVLKYKDGQLKGILLKDVLSHTVLAASSPKLFSRFYFTCIASDGYGVVYSWNELFNTDVGNHVFIIIEKNGIKADKMPESIQLTATTDFKTGRRYLHNLDKVVVGIAQ